MSIAHTAWSAPLPHIRLAWRAQGFGVRSVAAALSVILHGLLLIEAARFVMQIEEVPAPIAVTLLQVAPPPPALIAASPVAVVPWLPEPIPRVMQPVITQLTRKPQRPVLKRDRVKAPPEQLPSELSAPEAVVAPPSAAAAPPGSVGGVAGGVQSGQVGGTVGGRGDVVFRADQVATAPIAIKQTLPQYPAVARVRGAEGAVILEAVVDRDGAIEPSGIRVVESIPIFDAAAVAAVRTWRFHPGRDRDGRAVRVRVTVPLRFRLR